MTNGNQIARGRGFLLLALTILLSATPRHAPASGDAERTPPIEGDTFTLGSTLRSAGRIERLLDSLATRLILELGYVESAGARRLASDVFAGVRVFERPGDDGRRVELGYSRHPVGGYDLHVYGSEGRDDGLKVNRDLDRVRTELEALIEAVPEDLVTDRRDLAFSSYKLSYIKTDRALGLLKSLGYTTSEYEAREGESMFDSIFEPVLTGEWNLPVVIKMTDASKTSLMQEGEGGASRVESSVPEIGGSYLHDVTSSEPLQRLLLVYDESDPEPVEGLRRLLRDTIDVPARQVLIEALVMQIDSNAIRELGVTFSWNDTKLKSSFEIDPETQQQQPFLVQFDNFPAVDVHALKANLQALVQSGKGEVLSRPSVLVLDGRQARLQIGQQIPVISSTVSVGVIEESVEYFPVGIVLNLRPRLADDGSEVSMQVETVVSAVEGGSGSQTTTAGTVFVAPVVSNIQVETFVRVADDTPFIIGGMIIDSSEERRAGIPGLSELPLIGGLFRGRRRTAKKNEVLIILTPHILDRDDPRPPEVVAKDDDRMDIAGNEVFRDAYRLTAQDIPDFGFIRDSHVLRGTIARARVAVQRHPELAEEEPIATFARGDVPGEDVLVRAILLNVVREHKLARKIDARDITFFEPDRELAGHRPTVLRQALRDRRPRGHDALVLSFPSPQIERSGQAFLPPVAQRDSAESAAAALRAFATADAEPKARWSIILDDELPGDVDPLARLREILVLHRVMKLNDRALTLRSYGVGRRIALPTVEDLDGQSFILTADHARMFMESLRPYAAFERAFNHHLEMADQRLVGLGL